jgi:sugar phosphate isomerase/epimerase
MNNRRDFLRLMGLAPLSIPLLGSVACSTTKTNPGPGLKLSMQEGTTVGESIQEKFDFMESLGVVGFEPHGKALLNNADEYKKALENRGLSVSVVCAGFDGWLIADDETIRAQAMNSIKELLAVSGDFNALGLIVVPAFNSQASLPHKEARVLLVEQLKELGEVAAANNTKVILEPLNRNEAHFLRQVADAASICRDVDSPGVACMGDFWHMTWEETSDMGAFISGGEYLAHVHVASRERRKMPGEDSNDNYVDGFKALKMINYQGYVSFECGSVGEKSVTVPAAVQLLRDQWDIAQI